MKSKFGTVFACVAVLTLVTGCTRAVHFVAIVNDCATPITIMDDSEFGGFAVSSGGAVQLPYHSKPELWVESDGGAKGKVDLSAWPASPSTDVEGVVLVQHAFCAYGEPELVMELLDNRVVEDRYGTRWVDPPDEP